MNQETRNCQNCKKDFTIEPEDFEFYEKMKVPSPTWCFNCRLQRRMAFKNERILYRRPSDRSGKMVFSLYSLNAPIKLWSQEEWRSDDWDPLGFGREYNWNKSFFEQLKELMSIVPWTETNHLCVNSDYCGNSLSLKDCYLVFGSTSSENCYYSTDLSFSKDCYDSAYLVKSEIGYENIFNENCFRAFFSLYCNDSHDIVFCRDCVGVNNCFGCTGLRNKSYCIFNQPFSKEEYFARIKEFNLGSFSSLISLKEKVTNFWLSFPIKYINGRHNADVDGEYIYNSKNVKNSYHIDGGENLKFCFGLGFGKPAKDSYDHFRWGEGSELIYDTVMGGNDISRLKFCCACHSACADLTYSVNCESSSNLFGCVGLLNKQYCILNKQYTKEQYEELVPKIIQHMNEMPYKDKRGRIYKYGEFLPIEFSPFTYNETTAQEFYPLTKEQVIEQGYRWQDSESRNYGITKKSEELPDDIKDVPDSIINEVIQCAHNQTCNENCSKGFKLISQELEFYRRMNFPLPRLCPICRYYQRLKQRSPIELYKRKCQCSGTKSENGVYTNVSKHTHVDKPCSNEFETIHSPDKKEIVYCEDCYQNEVA